MRSINSERPAFQLVFEFFVKIFIKLRSSAYIRLTNGDFLGKIKPVDVLTPYGSNGGVVMEIEKNKKLSIISLLPGVAAVASTLAYFLYRLHSNRLHEEKWRDYEDCGI